MATALTHGADSLAPHPQHLVARHDSLASTRARASVSAPRDWRRRYARLLTWTDILVLSIAVLAAQLLWPQAGGAAQGAHTAGRITLLSSWVFSVVLILIWTWVLGLADSRTDRVIGIGTTEYTRLITSSFQLFGVIAIIAFLAKLDLPRGYLLISFPVGLGLLIVERRAWRSWLATQRLQGRFVARVLLVGSQPSVLRITHDFQHNPHAGYVVVGACTPDGRPIGDATPPVVGTLDNIIDAMHAVHADTVAVTSTANLPPSRLKQLSWELEAGRQHLVLAPSLIDVAGPRIHTRPVAGLPLIHVETPRFSRGQRLGKRMFDITVSTILILLLTPLLALLALLVKLTSPGPIFFVHERVGQHGQPFRMIKFRSMKQGADAQLAVLLAAQGTADTPLFKITDDPRITPIGRLLRKYSLDELPQLFNVLAGTMSLVGPRPQVAEEVALYTKAARRRLLFKPGISGLWQVSGRSDLDWTEAVRLDLYYVENWSLAGDLAILARTIKAVVHPTTSAR